MSNKRLKDSIGTGLSQVQEDRACKNCGTYNWRAVIAVDEAK